MCSSSKIDCGIKPLKKQFQGRGEVKRYQFTRIRQTDKAFIYEVSSSDGNLHWEVFRLIINKRFACVSYPTSKAFGIWSWTKMSLEKAEEKFDELNSL